MKQILIPIFMFMMANCFADVTLTMSSHVINSDESTKQITDSDIVASNPCMSFQNYVSCSNDTNNKKVCVNYNININSVVSPGESGSLSYFIENDNSYPFTELKLMKGSGILNNPMVISSTNTDNFQIQYCIKYGTSMAVFQNLGDVIFEFSKI